MGEVWEQSAFRWPIAVENHSSTDVADLKLSASCQCTVISPETLVIPPRGRADAILTMDLSFPPHAARLNDMPFKLRVLAHQRDDVGRSLAGEWLITGLVQRHLLVSPPSLDFLGADELVQGKEPPAVIVNVQPRVPLTSFDARLTPEIARLAVVPHAGDFELQLSGIDTSHAGNLEAEIVLTATDGAGQPLPERRIPVQGRIGARYVVTPEIVTFAPRPVGESVSASVRISSRGSLFAIDAPAADEGGIGFVPLVDGEQPENSREFELRMTIGARGDIEKRIPLRVRPALEDGVVEEIEFTVRAFGLDRNPTESALSTTN